jgi:AAA15 family ATPase/GTPase
MILQFELRNFRSVRDWQIFSLLAEKTVSEHEDTVIIKNNVHVLSSAIIYGRNASGKSNLLKGMAALQYLVLDSAKLKGETKIPQYQPYKLDVNSVNQPVEFKIEFIAEDNIKYRYEIGYNEKVITYENLHFYPHSQPAKLFERKGMQITYGERVTGRKKEIEDTLYENQLYLSKVGSEKLQALYYPFRFFSQLLFSYLDHDNSMENTLIQLYSGRLGNDNHKLFSDNLTKLIKAADINIESFIYRETKFNEKNLPEGMNEIEKRALLDRFRFRAGTSHKLFDAEEQVGLTELDLSDQSTGTLKLVLIGGLIIEALRDGQALLIDELDKSLHPKLTRALINLFNSPKTNPHNAQLIFATHDVSLLDNEIFRRDQIWLSEKEYQGCSHYYSVADIAGVRKDTPLEKWYMNGRFGGTPVIADQDLEFEF